MYASQQFEASEFGSIANNLGENNNGENFKLLVEGMKKLPENIQSFELNLSYNNVGVNDENLKYIA